MKDLFSPEQRREFMSRGFSRRDFARLAAFMTAGAALPFYNEAALAQGLSAMPEACPPDAVRINANENPMGPCPEAAEAIHQIVQQGGRYLYEKTFAFVAPHGRDRGPAPRLCPAVRRLERPACTGPSWPSPRRGRSFVVADPGYEAGERAAQFIGAKTVKVPLRKDASHDVQAMAAADPDAGLIYVCNPNNPTGSVTRKEDVEYLVANKPKGAVVLLDEAYIHLSSTAEPGTPLVAADKDVIILRTFSKLYGMAGLRAGAALARPDLLEKIKSYGAGALPVDRDGRRHRQPEGQGPGPKPAQDHRRHPRGDGRVARQERLRGHAVGSQHDHGRRPPAGPRRSARPCSRRRSPSAGPGRRCPTTSASRSARARRWRSSGRLSRE